MKWLCANEDADLQIDLTEHVCNVARAQAKRNRDMKDGEGDGVTFTHEIYAESRTELSKFREPYYKTQSRVRNELAALRRHIPRENPPGYEPDDGG